MNIREQIAEKCEEYDSRFPHELADSILILPSGLEAVKKCNDHIETTVGKDARFICGNCHGTGEIVRDLTVGMIIDVVINKDLASESGQQIGEVEYYLISTGERVRMKAR